MMTTRADVRRWAGEFEALTTRLAPRCGRREPRQRAVAYRRGLLSPIQRKNGWQLAEAAGDRTPEVKAPCVLACHCWSLGVGPMSVTP